MSLIKNELYNIDTGTWIQGQLDGGNTVTLGDYVQYVLTQLQTLDDFFLQCRYTEITYGSYTYPAIMLPFTSDTTAPTNGTGFFYGLRQPVSTTITSTTTASNTWAWCCSSSNVGTSSVQPNFSMPNAVQLSGSTVGTSNASQKPINLCVKLEVYDNFYGITFYNANSEVIWCNLKALILPSLNMTTNETSHMLLQLETQASTTNNRTYCSGANIGDTSIEVQVVGINDNMYDASTIVKLLPVVKDNYIATDCYFLSKGSTILLDNNATLNNKDVQQLNAVGDKYFNLNGKDYSIVYAQENYVNSKIILCLQEEDE